MNLYQKWCLKKAQIKYDRLFSLYNPKQKILDIGIGNGALNFLFQQNGLNITGLDIKNKSAFTEVNPVLYSGKKLPFKDKSFDVVQIITVLHHIDDPELTVREAMRVGKKVVIMEDIYESTSQKYLTHITDSFVNWEFKGHPHTNKTDQGWRDLFKEYKLELSSAEYYNFLAFFKQVTYVLETENLK
ncbi:class I SAM-dependent methyltransferase [Aureivirga marina]|uniref:class I SAM-dependent methyltransferase n=1 Tax=Aureivirga marina TaxID=1182451 RepID=UPI0018C9A8E4|nr:class I SAM-dependent methyltransferase [Aureivirga marina]